MQSSRHDAWVGFFVLLGGAALLFLALKAGNLLSLNFDATYQVTARFDNIGGLKPKAAVKSAGVVVGRVESISFDDKTFQAKVVINLQKDTQFPKDSSAKILTSGLLGEQYIGLEPGADEKNLTGGDMIKQTQSAVVLENLIGQFINSKAADMGSAAAPTAAASGSKP
jgi:phospholipid/cholesterol/gamma-HCH transport system substrate-binding protein